MTEFIKKDNYDSPALTVARLPTTAMSNSKIREEAPYALSYLHHTDNEDLSEVLIGKENL